MYSDKRPKDGQAIQLLLTIAFQLSSITAMLTIITLVSLCNSQALHKNQSKPLENVPAQVEGT